MAFWKKIFGRDFEESVAYAEALLRDGRPGEARLELESALSKSKGVSEARLAEVRGRLDEARDQLARQHARDGKAYAEDGDMERALECWETAVEVAASDEVRREIQAIVDELEAGDARAAYEETVEMTDEERFQVLSGAWEDERADELEEYGEAFREAFLDLHAGEAERAAEKMSALIEEYPDAVFLHLELGIALRNAGDNGRATGQLKQFLERLEEEYDQHLDLDDEDVELPFSDARVQARSTLAEIYLETKDAEAAEEELRELVELLPEKAGPYVHLGAFLREQGRYEEALEALEIGQEYMGSMRPDMRVVRELGLTHQAMGDRKAAIASLRAVVDYQASLSDFNFDPTTAVPLAELYEEEGDLKSASDLWRHLAAGTHAAGHLRYNREAGRLAAKLGDRPLAQKHLTRALELAEEDDERREIEALLEDLPSS